MLIVNLLFPDLMTPIANQYFDWGGAQILGTGGWLAFCLSLIAAGIAGWRRSRIL